MGKANSTSFQKGASGNPGGRTRGLEKQIRDLVASFRHVPDGHGAEVDGWTAIAYRAFRTATGQTAGASAAEETMAAKLLYERGYGRPKETVEIVEPVAEVEIDWEKVPLADRKRLLSAANEIEQLAEASSADESVEH